MHSKQNVPAVCNGGATLTVSGCSLQMHAYAECSEHITSGAALHLAPRYFAVSPSSLLLYTGILVIYCSKLEVSAIRGFSFRDLYAYRMRWSAWLMRSTANA